MIFEITRDCSIIVPVMIANLLSYFISQRLQPEPIYEALLHQDHIQLPITRAHMPAYANEPVRRVRQRRKGGPGAVVNCADIRGATRRIDSVEKANAREWATPPVAALY